MTFAENQFEVAALAVCGYCGGEDTCAFILIFGFIVTTIAVVYSSSSALSTSFPSTLAQFEKKKV